MLPEKPALVPEMEDTVESGEVTEDCRLAVKVLLPLVRVTAPGPKLLAVPLERLLGLPLRVQVTAKVLAPDVAFTDGLLQDTTVKTGTTRVIVALALPLSAWASVGRSVIALRVATETTAERIDFIGCSLLWNAGDAGES